MTTNSRNHLIRFLEEFSIDPATPTIQRNLTIQLLGELKKLTTVAERKAMTATV